MTRAFIVHLNIPDDTAVALAEVAQDIEDSLEGDGYDVDHVNVWTGAEASPIPPSGFVQQPFPPEQQPPSFP